MKYEEHLTEVQDVVHTMIRISRFTVIETGVMPANLLQTIEGLQDYCKAVRRNPEFVQKALVSEA